MTVILYLLVVSLAVAACGLAVFLWSLRSGQYDDLDGAANRILFDDASVAPPPRLAKIIESGGAPRRSY
jgi:cbb3-type cytochrome oxidase maturation protein